MSVERLEKFRNLSAADLGLNQVSQQIAGLQVTLSGDLEGAVQSFTADSKANCLMIDLAIARRYAASLLRAIALESHNG